MIINTNELPHDVYQKYKERLLKTNTLTYNENGILTPTLFFLNAVNSYIKNGLDKDIQKEAPTIAKSLIIAGSMLPFHHNIPREEFFHMLNICLINMKEPQFQNTYYDNFCGWLDYFFKPLI